MSLTLLHFLGDFYTFYSPPIPQRVISDSSGTHGISWSGPTNWAGVNYDMRSNVYFVQDPTACLAGTTITLATSIQEPIFLQFLAIAGADTSSTPVVSAITNPSCPGTTTSTASSCTISLTKPGLLVSWIRGDSDVSAVFAPQTGVSTDLNSIPTYLTGVFENGSSAGSYQSQFSISPADGWQVVIVGLHVP